MAIATMLGSLFLALGGTGAAGGANTSHSADVTYALMPLRNLSDDPSAALLIGARIESELTRRGARFVAAQDLDDALRVRRVRYTDSLSKRDSRDIARELGADFILAGTVIQFDASSMPQSAFALRAIAAASGEREASAAVTMRGADFEGLLGLGVITDSEELLELTVERALSAFDARGRPLPQPKAPEHSGHATPPDKGWGYFSPHFDASRFDRVAILPLTNRSADPNAQVAWSELLGDAWFRHGGVRVVEPAEVRAALVRLKVRSMEFVDLAGLAQLGRELETRYFALGTIERFGEEAATDTDRFPEIEATVRIIDVENGEIVAAAGVRRRGDHYRSLLGLGVVRNPLGLAERTASEIIAALRGSP